MFRCNKHQDIRRIIFSCSTVSFLGLIFISAFSRKANAQQPEGKVQQLTTYGYNQKTVVPMLDTIAYNIQTLRLVHGKVSSNWPVKTQYPLAGAIFPFERIVAYYGNFYAKGMGVLGELPEPQMLGRLREEVHKWEMADPQVPIVPAIHYIAVTAQDNAGQDGKYRLRMPKSEIEKALRLADLVQGIVILDIQVGLSTLEEELPELEPYLSLPNVHLGIDPEYSMKGGQVPCTVIGTFDAKDINYATAFLAAMVKTNKLSPKVLIVHRFTKDMVTNYKDIIIRPEVQIVMDMDGFGFPAKKIDSYKNAIVKEPVQFAGFKLFYKYDISKGSQQIMTPKALLDLYPRPVYIQYQ